MSLVTSMFLLSFPDEILVNILHFIPLKELNHIFLLDASTCHSYYQNLAIYAKYFKANVVINSFASFADNGLSTLQLGSLVDSRIFIQPRSVEIVLQGIHNGDELQLTVDNVPLVDFISRFQGYLLALLTSTLMRIDVYKDDIYLASSFHADRLLTILIASVNVKSLSVTYKRIEKRRSLVLVPAAPVLQKKELLVTSSDCNIENLKLHLYNSSSLMNHIINNPFPTSPLQSLDLSYNHISDDILSTITFPPLIKHLNLSNNSISCLSFPIWDSLESINVSNNNISNLNYTSHTNVQELNLSCNYITNNSIPHLKHSFPNLINLDLSRNLLIFTLEINLPKLRKLNLQGNRFIKLQSIPKLLREIDLTYCKVHEIST